MKYLKSILVIILGLLAITVPVSADIFTPEPSEDYHYIFVFDYKKSKASVQNLEYTIMTGPRTPVLNGAYLLVIKNRSGNDLVSITFDPASMANNLGIVKIAVPYQPSGTQAIIVGSSGAVVGRADLSLSSTCNDNAMCDSAVGEDIYNCPIDCPSVAATSPTISSSPSVSVPAAPEDAIPMDSSLKKRWGLIVLALIAGSGAVGVGLLLHRYRSQQH